MAVLESRPEGLYCPDGDFYVDPWKPVPRAVLTHLHGDHAVPGSASYLCAAPGAAVARKRLPGAPLQPLGYGERLRLGSATVSLHPAGHVLGSAQVRVETRESVWVVTGDYKRADDPTCAPFEPVACDTLITEATFGLPIYRWAPAGDVVAEIAAWWERARGEGRACAVFCYALGKAQRLLAELARLTGGLEVLCHGAIEAVNDAYRTSGVALPPTRRLDEDDRGKALAGKLILAPPSAKGSPWLKRLPDGELAFVSGWMRVRGRRRRGGYDRGFALSDHADWPALLATVRDSGASRVLVTHGLAEPLARYLRESGVDARTLASPYGDEEED